MSVEFESYPHKYFPINEIKIESSTLEVNDIRIKTMFKFRCPRMHKYHKSSEFFPKMPTSRLSKQLHQ
jgi:hypothetical protein